MDHMEDPRGSSSRRVRQQDANSMPIPFPLKSGTTQSQSAAQKETSATSSLRTSASDSRRATRQHVLSVCNSLSDKTVANCNRRFWLQNVEGEAKKLWRLGEEMRAVFKGSEEEIVERLIEMEKRDQQGWTKMTSMARDGEEDGA
ncbi:uncharacterized protein LOC130721213 [Lotus japonicus]|uniref:uncharacterized protein LOC130721213 n=1 Tax=Lotus japonicus TaxID=34305 RepID=UPI0025861B55|nr:uncharacterized protein LOC130721213 [Lotus japonicus]